MVQFTVGGSAEFEFNITINDDDDFEGFHSFELSFDMTPFSAVGTNSTTIVEISDFDGEFLFIIIYVYNYNA